jgi:hypothetical protein
LISLNNVSAQFSLHHSNRTNEEFNMPSLEFAFEKLALEAKGRERSRSPARFGGEARRAVVDDRTKYRQRSPLRRKAPPNPEELAQRLENIKIDSKVDVEVDDLLKAMSASLNATRKRKAENEAKAQQPSEEDKVQWLYDANNAGNGPGQASESAADNNAWNNDEEEERTTQPPPGPGTWFTNLVLLSANPRP